MAERLAVDSTARIRGNKPGDALRRHSAQPTAVVIQNRTKEGSVVITRSSGPMRAIPITRHVLTHGCNPGASSH